MDPLSHPAVLAHGVSDSAGIKTLRLCVKSSFNFEPPVSVPGKLALLILVA